jgi:hypothetical protein
MTDFKAAPAVARIAEDLIPRHHPDLVGERIEYVFRKKATKSKGREVWGTARLIGGLNAFLATDDDERPYDGTVESFFVIEIAEDIWGEIDSTQRVALVDHELCHLRHRLHRGRRGHRDPQAQDQGPRRRGVPRRRPPPRALAHRRRAVQLGHRVGGHGRGVGRSVTPLSTFDAEGRRLELDRRARVRLRPLLVVGLILVCWVELVPAHAWLALPPALVLAVLAAREAWAVIREETGR